MRKYLVTLLSIFVGDVTVDDPEEHNMLLNRPNIAYRYSSTVQYITVQYVTVESSFGMLTLLRCHEVPLPK